jgi:hypothetical protein
MNRSALVSQHTPANARRDRAVTWDDVIETFGCARVNGRYRTYDTSVAHRVNPSPW